MTAYRGIQGTTAERRRKRFFTTRTVLTFIGICLALLFSYLLINSAPSAITHAYECQTVHGVTLTFNMAEYRLMDGHRQGPEGTTVLNRTQAHRAANALARSHRSTSGTLYGPVTWRSLKNLHYIGVCQRSAA